MREIFRSAKDRAIAGARAPAAKQFVPVFFEQALATLASMLGTFLIAGVGDAAIAGVGLIDTLNFLFMNFAVNIALGVTALVAQAVGRGSPEEAGRMASQSLVLSVYMGLGLALPMMVFARPILIFLYGGAEPAVIDAAHTFLMYSMGTLPLLSAFSVLAGIRRGENDNISPLMGSLAANVMYIVIALFCINVLGLGVDGVGWGMVASRVSSVAVVAWTVARHPHRVALTRLSPKLSMKLLAPMLRISLPSAADTVMFNGGKIIVKVFMAGMGTAALAADTICNVLTSFLQLPGRVFNVTSVALTGQAFGSGDMRAARGVMIRQTLFACVSIAVMTVGFFIFLRPLVTMYTADPVTEAYCMRIMMLMLAVTALLWPPSFVTPASLRATGDAGYTMYVSLGSMFILRVFGSWFLGVYLGMNLYGVWLAMVADWVLRGAFFGARVFSMRWKKHYRASLYGDGEEAHA